MYKVLRDYKLTNMCEADDPSCGYPLVDAVSNSPPSDISTGEEQLGELAAEIAYHLALSPTPSATLPPATEKAEK